MPALPEGFVLDQAPSAAGLPQGFVLDDEAPKAASGVVSGETKSLTKGGLPTLSSVKETFNDATTGLESGIPFADEIVAAAGAPLLAGVNYLTDKPNSGEGLMDRLGVAYHQQHQRDLARMREAQERSPVATTMGGIASGAALGGTAAKGGLSFLNAAKPTLRSMVGRGAAEGASYGALYGAGEGNGLEDRLTRAGSGAVTGGVTGGILGTVGRAGTNKAARKTIPTTDELKAQSHAAYQAAEDAGVIVKPNSYDQTVSDIFTTVSNEGVDPTLHPRAMAAMKRLEELKGMPLSFKTLDVMRRVVKAAASSREPDERRIASMMVEKLDDWMSNLTPADVVTGDAKTASASLKLARQLWSRVRKADLIQEAVDKAERRAASTGSGGNVDNAIRQNIRAILDNPKKARGFTKAERAAMEKVVRGGKLQNLARLVGKLSPEGNGLMMGLHTVGGIATGGLSTPLMIAGAGAKRFADSATPRNVAALSDLVRSGGQIPARQVTNRGRAALQAGTVAAAQQLPRIVSSPSVAQGNQPVPSGMPALPPPPPPELGIVQPAQAAQTNPSGPVQADPDYDPVELRQKIEAMTPAVRHAAKVRLVEAIQGAISHSDDPQAVVRQIWTNPKAVKEVETVLGHQLAEELKQWAIQATLTSAE